MGTSHPALCTAGWLQPLVWAVSFHWQLVARPTAHTGQKSEHRGNLPQNPVVLENVDSSAHDARQGERRRRVQLPSMSKESMVIPHAAVSEVLQASLAGLCL